MSLIWIVWSTLYVYLCLGDQTRQDKSNHYLMEWNSFWRSICLFMHLCFHNFIHWIKGADRARQDLTLKFAGQVLPDWTLNRDVYLKKNTYQDRVWSSWPLIVNFLEVLENCDSIIEKKDAKLNATVTGLANFGFTYLLWRPQGRQGCLEKRNYPLSSNFMVWCAKIGS